MTAGVLSSAKRMHDTKAWRERKECRVIFLIESNEFDELRCKVDHKDIFQNGFEGGNKGFVLRMWKVLLAGLLVFKGHNKAVSEIFIKFFGTVVLSPLDLPDALDFRGQADELLFNPLYLFWFCRVLELDANNMLDYG